MASNISSTTQLQVMVMFDVRNIALDLSVFSLKKY